MKLSVFCEPVAVSPTTQMVVEHIQEPSDSPQRGPYLHFHDACEVLWFRKATGQLFTDSETHQISRHVAVYVPTMLNHDFLMDAGEKDFVLIHMDPAVAATLLVEDRRQVLNQTICSEFDGEAARRMDMLFSWLNDLSRSSEGSTSTMTRLAKLILSEMNQARKIMTDDTPQSILQHERLRAALDLVATNPSAELSLNEAASACHLSTAYFSRRFKATFGMNFSEYVRVYRLRLAARQLITTGQRIADIAYGLGFATPAHFTALFQKRFGVTPRAYRAAAQS